jgi:hypothetical protein
MRTLFKPILLCNLLAFSGPMLADQAQCALSYQTEPKILNEKLGQNTQAVC